MITPIRFKITCDCCRKEKECGERIPEGWTKKGKRRHYCWACSKVMDPKAQIRFPASVLVHTPSGPLAACLNHAAAAGKVYGVLGCHVNVTPLREPMACINCMNEAKEEKHA